ncbi:hypothetical protein SOCEGT47_010060 [Sorangium cellulosum]|uniref:Secreted protein n=1 Tax=Sorangium cellulosum TaxID=56 RepID=A0A4P2PV17_SORCE|nr:hypothetical protein [Sorangium cellulosum]AUX20534.1 hypothetical protein SOCEGT47_010060 [Sorangium cellulosum]
MRGHASKVLRLAVVAFACAMMAACGGPLRYTPQGIGKAPGADAVVIADINFDAAMTRLDVTAKNLPPPERLDASSTAFVVWARPDGSAPWQRIGALNYDADGRTGKLKDVSVPLTRFELVVSLEKNINPEEPSSEIVFQQIVEY